jgi:hypothetical protein
MTAGRTARIAALVFALTLAFSPGEAPALELPGVESAQAAVPGVPSLPALPSITALPTAPAPPTAPLAQPAPAPAQQSSSPPAARGSSSSSATPKLHRLIPRESGRLLGGSDPRAGSTPSAARISRVASHRKARRPRASHSSPAGRHALPSVLPSRFGHLGDVAEPTLASPFLSGVGNDGPASGMGWAAPLLAIMLPIGLCGFLQTARRS